ncbi:MULTISPECIES: metal-sensing transcriptional repressor [Mycobacterium]
MVDEDKCCNNVLTQIGAASSALRPVAPKLLDDHLNDRVSEAVARGGKEANVKLSEAPAALARLVRS